MGNTLTDITAFGRDVAGQTGYPGVLGGIHHGLTALGRAVRWSELHRAAPAAAAPPLPASGAGAAELELTVPDEPGASWSEHRASAFLAEHGIPVVPSTPGHQPDAGGRRPPTALGYPVVVKLAADEIEHKSDIGGVKIGLARPRPRCMAAYADVVSAGQAGRRRRAPARWSSRSAPGGIELLVGIVTDPAWGQVLAVGLGGVWVEILRDTAAHACSRPAATQILPGRCAACAARRLFDGPRGTEKADLDAVADAIAAVAALAQRLGDRLEALEINPLLVRGSQVEALDALITWRKIESKSLSRTDRAAPIIQ